MPVGALQRVCHARTTQRIYDASVTRASVAPRLAACVPFWLAACGAPASGPAVTNRATSSGALTCELPPTIAIDAHQYANVDANDPRFEQWLPWTARIASTRDGDRVHATVELKGSSYRWTFDAAGTFDCTTHELTLHFGTHEPFDLSLDLALHAGEIRSIDNVWLLGPPFPARH